MPSLTQPANAKKVIVIKGLQGQDDNLDLLQSYFEELKAVTVEPSAPDVDFLTFVGCTDYFGVITIEPGTQEDVGDDDAEGEPEEDSVDAGYIASPPPPSATSESISSATSFVSACSAIRFGPVNTDPGRSDIGPATPEEEKVLRWREAFLSELQESDDEQEPLLSKGKMPETRNIQSIQDKRPDIGTSVPNQTTSNNLDDYINWPDDITPDEDQSENVPMCHTPLPPYHETGADSWPKEAEFTRVLGREILEPERFSSPVREIPEIPTDPGLLDFVHAEAIRFRDTLRAQRIQAYQEASASRPAFIQPHMARSTPIGIVYLVSSQTIDDNMHRGQLNIGIYVAPNYIKQRGLVDAIKHVVNEAFQDPSCHRVQAIVVDHKTKLHTWELFTSTGFSREGTGRREFFSPVTHEWKDVFYFAILDTDWILYHNGSHTSSLAPRRRKTLWDDLLARQQREREELLKMEKTLKRSSSIETIRGGVVPAATSVASTSKSETSSVGDSSMGVTTSSAATGHSRKRRRTRKRGTGRSKAPSSSTSSSMGTIDTMSTISSEWELPARQAFAIPASNSTSPPISPVGSASTSPIGRWVVLDVSEP